MIIIGQDDHIKEMYEFHTRWIVTLSNFDVVYQDDWRTGKDFEQPTWLRLKEHCLEKKLYIKNIRLQNRSHNIAIPSEKEGYYFTKAVGGTFGGPNFHLYFVGWVEKGGVIVQKYKIPELIKRGTEVREIEECREFLIEK